MRCGVDEVLDVPMFMVLMLLSIALAMMLVMLSMLSMCFDVVGIHIAGVVDVAVVVDVASSCCCDRRAAAATYDAVVAAAAAAAAAIDVAVVVVNVVVAFAVVEIIGIVFVAAGGRGVGRGELFLLSMIFYVFLTSCSSTRQPLTTRSNCISCYCIYHDRCTTHE